MRPHIPLECLPAASHPKPQGSSRRLSNRKWPSVHINGFNKPLLTARQREEKESAPDKEGCSMIWDWVGEISFPSWRIMRGILQSSSFLKGLSIKPQRDPLPCSFLLQPSGHKSQDLYIPISPELLILNKCFTESELGGSSEGMQSTLHFSRNPHAPIPRQIIIWLQPEDL